MLVVVGSSGGIEWLPVKKQKKKIEREREREEEQWSRRNCTIRIKYHPNFTTKECSVKGEWSDQDNLRISFACDVEMTKILANLPRLEWIHEWIR